MQGISLWSISRFLTTCSLIFISYCTPAQDIHFNLVKTQKDESLLEVTGMSQDQQGFIWLAVSNGLYRYDGHQFKSYHTDVSNSNSVASNTIESVHADKQGFVWVGTYGSGLDRLDPLTGIFTHYRHQLTNPSSIGNDTITAILKDHNNILWVGTYGGLERLDPKTGRFTHYHYHKNDAASLSCNQVRKIYEDREGTLWVGTGSAFDGTNKKTGGLNKLDQHTGKFTRYLHSETDSHTLTDNRIRAIFEDSRGVFWVGSAGDGLHIMDRKNGTFERYTYNAAHPEKLSRPPVKKVITYADDHITFITEDIGGKIWIGTLENGINIYDPKTQKTTHYGQGKNTTGLATDEFFYAFKSKDGILWMSSWGFDRNVFELYKVNPYQTTLPYYHIGKPVFGFVEDAGKNLWIASKDGLILNDTLQRKQTFFPVSTLKTGSSRIFCIEKDIAENKLWLSTYHGLYNFDPQTKTLKRYARQPGISNSLGSDSIVITHQRKAETIWIGTDHSGLDEMNTRTGAVRHYKNEPKDSTSLSNNYILTIESDKTGHVWVGTPNGLNRLDEKTGGFKRYLKDVIIYCLAEDKNGELWTGTNAGLFKYDRATDHFSGIKDDLGTINSSIVVYRLLKDKEKDLWLSTTKGLVKLNVNINETTVYGKDKGLGNSSLAWSAYCRDNGDILLGDTSGYFFFSPVQLARNNPPTTVNINNFLLADIPVIPGKSSVLTEPVGKTKKIGLAHNQNTFSFGFENIDYVSEGDDNQLLYKLENYDGSWHIADDSRTANYFNVAPGNYVFKIKAVNSSGIWTEKDIKVVILPPWWQRWWAYVIFVVLLVGSVWLFVYYRSLSLIKEKRLLEHKVHIRTAEVLEQKEEIATQRDSLEQAFEELKTTQSQLIQREKLASLGELTSGIAHEIQNPLNFVNNFAEVSSELVEELAVELHQEKLDERMRDDLIDDLRQNLEKITTHGKRADAIVKNMLQHSGSSSGGRTPTDINTLVNEFIHLSYNALRVKNKAFIAGTETDFDEKIGEINIVPQDIGRILLNLFNNAFYAVNEKRQMAGAAYKPTVSVKTKLLPSARPNGISTVEIRVRDNGMGIPEAVKTKIMQPFFTTKPTGEGTGLGLSLSYDIISKGYGGTIQIDSKENEYAEFTITLPIKDPQ